MATDNPPGAKAETEEGDVVSIELPAPPGWTKKFTPKKVATPRRNEIAFTAPTGEEIKSKRQLELYLKSHPGGPSAKDFDWGTGDTPRRSARLTEKSKATESPDNDIPKKRQRKSSSKKGAKEKSDANEDETVDENEANAEVVKEDSEVNNADAEDAIEHDDKVMVSEKFISDTNDNKDSMKKTAEGEAANEEQVAAVEESKAPIEEPKETAVEQMPAYDFVDVQPKIHCNQDTSKDKEDVQLKSIDNEYTDMCKEENQVSDGKQQPNAEGEDCKNASALLAEPTDPNKEVGSSEMVLDPKEDVSPTMADPKGENSVVDAMDLADQPEESSDVKVESADVVVADNDSSKKNEAENRVSKGSDELMQEASKGKQDVSS